MLGSRNGGSTDLGDRDKEWGARVHLPVRVFARHVHTAGAGGAFQRHARPSAKGRSLDGMDQASLRIDHVGRCGVLPCADGAAPHLKAVQHQNHNLNQMNLSTLFPSSKLSLIAVLAAVTLASAPSIAQDLG